MGGNETMTEKRYIRNIVGQVYDVENDKFYDEDFEGKPLEYEDDVIKLLNEQDQEIEELRELLDIGETNAKSILDVLNYQQSQINKTIEVLQKHYNYAYDQRQKNLDNAIVAKAYDVLRSTVDEIANELGIEIKK